MTTPEQPEGRAPEGRVPEQPESKALEKPESRAPEKPKRGSKKQPPGSPLDTDKLTEGLAASTRTKLERIDETGIETASRLRIAEEDAKAERDEKRSAMDHRRRVELIALCGYIGLSAVVAGSCLWVLADKTIAPQDKAWVGPTLTLVIGGVAGYLTGRSSVRPPDK